MGRGWFCCFLIGRRERNVVRCQHERLRVCGASDLARLQPEWLGFGMRKGSALA